MYQLNSNQEWGIGFGTVDATLTTVNCAGINTSGAGCSKRVSTFFPFPTGGPGGPVLVTWMPEMPRSVGKIDSCTLLFP